MLTLPPAARQFGTAADGFLLVADPKLRPDTPGGTALPALAGTLRRGQIATSTPVGPIVLPEDPAYWAGFVIMGRP